MITMYIAISLYESLTIVHIHVYLYEMYIYIGVIRIMLCQIEPSNFANCLTGIRYILHILNLTFYIIANSQLI